MAGDYLSVFNASSVLQDSDIINAIPAWQQQLDYEFPYYWGLTAYIDFGGSGTPIIITDNPGPNDPAGALGYHYIDGNYNPYAIIFAALSESYGVAWTGVTSHEILELCADQLIDTTDLYDNGDGTGFIVLQEVCDPVEESLYYEGANNTIVSDFVTPAWYVPGDPNQVDFLGAIGGPWQLASGGYVSYQYVQLGGWQQASADTVANLASKLRNQIAIGGNPRSDIVKGLQRSAAQTASQQQPMRAQQQGSGRFASQIGQRQSPQVIRTGQQRPQARTSPSVAATGPQQRGLVMPVGPRIQTKPTGQIRVVPSKDVPQVAAAAQAARSMGAQVGGRPNGSN